MIELDNFNKAVVVSGDGDFYCLIEHLIKIGKFDRLLVPNEYKYSALLKTKEIKEYTDSINELRYKINKRQL